MLNSADLTLDPALDCLLETLAAARRDDPESLEAVWEQLELVNGLVVREDVEPHRFAEVRARIDGALAGISALLAGLNADRQRIGQGLAHARGRRSIGSSGSSGSRIDFEL